MRPLLLLGAVLLLGGCRSSELRVSPCEGLGVRVSLLIEASLKDAPEAVFWDGERLLLKQDSDGAYAAWSAELPRCPEPGSQHELRITSSRGSRTLRVFISRDYQPGRGALCVRYEEREVSFLEALGSNPLTRGCSMCLAGGAGL